MSQDEPDILEALASLPSFHHPTVSPDGSAIAMYYDGTGRNELVTLDPGTGAMDQWSDGDVPRNARWFVQWADDRILYHLDEAGNEQNDIWGIDRDGTTEPIVELDGQCVVGDIADDASMMLFGSTQDGQMNVYRYDFADGEIAQLTEYDRAVWSSILSPDCEQFAYTTNETDNFDNRDIYVADIDGSNARNLHIGEVGAEATIADWSDDDALLVTDNSDDLARIGVHDLDGGSTTWLGDLAYEEYGVTFMPDGERVIGIRIRGATVIPVVYDLQTGEGREFDLPDGVASLGAVGQSSVVLDDDAVMVQFTSPTRRPELLRYDLETDSAETLIEPEYGPFDPGEFADATYITFTSDGVPETRQAAIAHEPYDEFEIGAILYDAGTRPSPLLVNPHGGPRSQDTLRFNVYAQVMAALGFSVLQVNYRGSTGRGRAFVEELIGDWGGAEQGDVASAVEHVLDTYDWLDDERVVVFGGSYGGYSAYWQLVQYPDLYDAGVAWIGVTDLVDIYENTMPHFQTELMEKYLETPDDNPTLYEERSPATHAGNLSAPLLIVHGINDRRVPVSQARIFRDRLLEEGFVEDYDFEYVELGEEGHASTDQEQKLRMFRTLEDFLTRRIELS